MYGDRVDIWVTIYLNPKSYQLAALRPAALLPRPQGAPRTQPKRHIVFFILLLQVPSLSAPIPSNNFTRACVPSRRG